MNNHTYHVSLDRIDSRWVVCYRRIILAAKVVFSAIVAYTIIVKAKTAEVFKYEFISRTTKGRQSRRNFSLQLINQQRISRI